MVAAYRFDREKRDYLEAPWVFPASPVSLAVWMRSLAECKQVFLGLGSLKKGALSLGTADGMLISITGVGKRILAPQAEKHICDGRWHHILGVWDGVGHHHLYADGVLWWAGPYPKVQPDRLSVGCTSGCARALFYTGDLARCRAFARSLNREEIAGLAEGRGGRIEGEVEIPPHTEGHGIVDDAPMWKEPHKPQPSVVRSTRRHG